MTFSQVLDLWCVIAINHISNQRRLLVKLECVFLDFFLGVKILYVFLKLHYEYVGVSSGAVENKMIVGVEVFGLGSPVLLPIADDFSIE